MAHLSVVSQVGSKSSVDDALGAGRLSPSINRGFDPNPYNHPGRIHERVAKSKFGTMPNFAKAGSGWVALQGDHGQVSFRNIKIRPIVQTSGQD